MLQYHKTLKDGLLDPFTFGTGKASVVLANLLNEKENSHFLRKVGKNLSRFSTVASEIIEAASISKEHKKLLVYLYFKCCYEFFESSKMSNSLKSYCINVLTDRKRKFLKKIV